MKKTVVLLFAFAITCCCYAQNVSLPAAVAKSMVQANRAALALSPDEMDNLKPAQAYTDPQTGVSYIYLQQHYLEVPVHNRIIVTAYKNGRAVSKAGRTVNIPAEAGVPLPGLTPEAAIVAAAAHVKAKTPLNFGEKTLLNGKYTFGLLNIAYENITVQLFWLPLDADAKNAPLQLVWQVFLAPAGTDDMWQIRVDAHTGTVINKNNLTVFEHFDAHKVSPETSPATAATALPFFLQSPAPPEIVNSANYTVIPYPVESPVHGTAAIVSNPWLLAGATNPNAVSLTWHSDGTNDYAISRGNNVWATEDRANTNGGAIVTPTGLPASSSTGPDPLNFIHTPDYTVAPTTAPFQQFAITNLFYWNNIIHDITYNYGFDEVSGNFQNSNQGRGGSGGDYVIALAQSASGNNNANFATPPDGSRPRMRMYLWTAPNPDRDGDLDNGIVTHEYGHGVSNRLTGGIAGGGGCLSNDEQGGEGWSDYLGLMLTTNWGAAQVTDGFNVRRPIGTYALNQNPATGNGIRSRPYITNFAVNNLTYNYVASSGGGPHDIGEVWCSALWDMTWNIIQTDGINPNLFNASGSGGNSKALRLVMEGMKLQPCSPGFLDSRDAILQADQILYNGQYRCAILNAFARRGMGSDAKQGSSGSTTDQVAGFSIEEGRLTLTQSVTQQAEGQQVTYTNLVVAGPCAALTNYLLTDTLPNNVTYVSGGSYNAATRVVSFPVNLAAGASQSYSFTVQINPGTYFPTVTLFEDLVTGATINPAIWTTSTTVASNWVVSTARSFSPTSSYFSSNTTAVSDKRLFSTNAIALGATPPNLSFRHWFSTEATYDGGVLEISTDNGTTYTDVGVTAFLKNGYTATMSSGTPLAGRPAWTGNSGGWIESIVNLTPYANQSIKMRFRSTTDNGTALEGWYVDDIRIRRVAQVDIRSSLFNSAGVRTQIQDTLTLILPGGAPCTAVSITTQPSSATACAGANVTFSVTAAGASPSYVWQVSTDGGTTYNPVVPAATGPSLTLNGVTGAMNGYRYRVVVSNNCPSTATSQAALLTVQTPPVITTQPTSVTTCTGTSATFTVAATGTAVTYQWQSSPTGCAGTFTDIPGAQSASYNIPSVTAGQNGTAYRVIVSGTCAPASVTSNCVTLTVNNSTTITQQPAALSLCAGASATFTAAATGGTVTYQWQVSTNGGTTFTDIPGANTASYNIPAVTTALNGNLYRAVISSNCASGLTTQAALLTVQSTPSITQQPSDITSCTTSATFTVTAPGTGIQYQWQVSTDGGTTYTDIPGANASTYSVNLTPGMSQNRYRVRVFTASCGSVTSNSVTARAGVTPAVVLTAGPATFAPSGATNPAQPSGLYTTVSPVGNYVYQWTLNGQNLGVVGPTVTPAGGLLNAFGTYKVTVFDVATGCSGTSNEVTISDIASERNRLFIYPNPSRGVVNVSYYSSTGAAEARMLNLYDAKGSRVMTKAFSVSGNYGIMSFDMSGMTDGVYMLELRDAQGNRIAGEQILKR